MKDILIRLLIAATLTLAAFALSSSSTGQQSPGQQGDEDATPTAPTPQGKTAQSSNPAQTSPTNAGSSVDDQTQNQLAFTGRIEQEKGLLVLKDPITKLSYQLDDQLRAKHFIGKRVKVTGKLGMRTNAIQVANIELIP